MTLRRVFPTPATAVDDLNAAYAIPRDDWMRANLILSIDGSPGGSDGTSRTLTRGQDRRVLGAIRRAASVVLVGASSIRSEGHLLPQTAALAIVTTSGDLTGHAIPRDAAEGKVIVLAPETAIDVLRATFDVPAAELVPVGDGPLSPTAIVAALRRFGHRSIVCEGGPGLVAQFIAHGALDELCLSTAPVLVGPSHPLFAGERARSARLDQLLVDEAGVSYARWRLAGLTATG